jgi:FtsZ-binding cell division protein ZapB
MNPTEHAPNTPRERNAKGQKVDEPVQCVKCLQAWPCEVEVLREENTALLRINRGLRHDIDDLRERIRELLNQDAEQREREGW